MNINVTSDRVEWQTGKYQFIMSFGSGTNYFTLNIPDVFFPAVSRTSLHILCGAIPVTMKLSPAKRCNQYTILSLKDDHAKQDVTPEDSE